MITWAFYREHFRSWRNPDACRGSVDGNSLRRLVQLRALYKPLEKRRRGTASFADHWELPSRLLKTPDCRLFKKISTGETREK